jgi:glycosyltransferase involved in cell wall biosynthesis
LFVGITAWNSAALLGHCIDAVKTTTKQFATRIVVLDNQSTDGSRELALSKGVEVISKRCNQSQALVRLFNSSRCEYTLLIHSDVVLLSENWLDVCASRMKENVVMISPEDVGCGPYTRPWGKGMPESSFLLFRTAPMRAARQWYHIQRFKIRWPFRAVDFFGEHVTYNLPSMLEAHGLSWRMMAVHTSTTEVSPIYTPSFKPLNWETAWGYYRYGLGNFYSLDGHITHYHNWFDRTAAESLTVDLDSHATFPKEGGLPLAYVGQYTQNFLNDLKQGKLVLPDVTKILPATVSDLN